MSLTADEPCTDAERTSLLRIALKAIEAGLETGKRLDPEPGCYPPALAARGASFVTLKRSGNLRGCIGSLTPVSSLLEDVARNAYAAAFRDPRFPALSAKELQDLEIEISVLGPTEPVEFSSEQELQASLRPGIDGLVLQDGRNRGTFLPSVWESLPEPADFLSHLKAKAGLPRDYWSGTVEIERYTTRSFAASVVEIRRSGGTEIINTG